MSGTNIRPGAGDRGEFAAAYTVRLWALRRLLGLAMILDGLTTFLIGWKPGAALGTAKRMAGLRHQKMLRERTVR